MTGTRRAFRDTLLILAISAALLLLAELFVRLFLPQDYRTTSVNGLSLGMDDSVLGHLNRPGAHLVLEGPEFSVDYRVGDQGFRDTIVHTPVKPDSLLRILLLGDSFTWGAGVEYGGIWPVVFERACAGAGMRCDIIKAGVSGYDTRQEVLYLERLLPVYKPDAVILAFLPNDLATNLPVAGNDSLETLQALKQDSLLVRNQGDKDSRLQLVSLLKRLLLSNDAVYSKLYFNTDRSQYFALPANDRLRGQMEVTRQLLARALSFCRANRTAFVVLSIPQQIQVLVKAGGSAPEGIDVDFVDREFSSFAHDHSFAWIPALPALAERYRTAHTDLFFRLNGHLNREGNAVVGRVLFEKFGEAMRMGRN